MPGITATAPSGSLRSNRCLAIKHFEKFCLWLGREALNQLCSYRDNNNNEVLVLICPEGTEPLYGNLDLTTISKQVLDHFASYLFEEATYLNCPDLPLVFTTADNYFSQAKKQMVDDLYKERKPENPALTDPAFTTQVRAALKKSFIDRCEAQQRPLIQEKETATSTDIFCTVLMAVLSGSAEMAMFALFLITLIQFAGRGTEIAKLVFANIKMVHPMEFPVAREKIAEVFLWRKKTGCSQDLSIFGHR
jgi:hypothetical protein